MSAICNITTPAEREHVPSCDVVAVEARLRVAAVVPPHTCRWLADAIRHAAAWSGIELTVLAVANAARPATTPAFAFDLRFYLALERLRGRSRRGGAFASVDVVQRAREGGVAVVELADEAALHERLSTQVFDLVLAATAFAAADAFAASTEWGCWHVGYDLTDRRGAGLGFLAPLIDGDAVTPMNLYLQADGTGMMLASSPGATQGGSFDLQRERAFRKLPTLLLRALRALTQGEAVVPRRQVASLWFGTIPGQLSSAAGARALLVSVRNTIRGWQRRWSDHDRWFVALRNAGAPLDPAQPEVGVVRCLIPPAHLDWADPFVVDDGERRLVFVEEYGLRDQRGVIACLELLADGSARRLGLAIDEPYHVSYPQVFRHEGDWYLTIESGAARRARLYRASAFPLRWEPVADLLSDCACVDPTLRYHDGHWYLFASLSDNGADAHDELFLFIADTLSGPYRPHPCNPVVKDVRRARPAGALFVHGGRLVRPAQDCAPVYGAAVVFNEVLELSPTAYRERPLARLDASWMRGAGRCHTYSVAGGDEVLDASGRLPRGTVRIPVDEARAARQAVPGAAPSVSVIVTVCDHERFLAQALDSALTQSLSDSEIIVVVDGSTDQSGALADRYAAEHSGRVRVLHQENQGPAQARNAAIAIARGRYLALLDVDAVWLPDHLAACVDVLERDPSIGLVHADAEEVDADGNVRGSRQRRRWAHDADDAFSALLLRRQRVVRPTAVIRRSMIGRVGGFDARFSRVGGEDCDLWLRIVEVANVAYLDELHARCHVRDGAGASQEWSRLAHELLVEKHCTQPRRRRLRRHALAAIEIERSHELAGAASTGPALRAFLRVLARDPLCGDAWKGLVRRLVGGRRAPISSP